LMLDLGNRIIIVEVDENKHDGYDCSCENKRLMELSKDVSHRPIVFIRFNPDGYMAEDGQRVSSCWKVNKQGILVVSKVAEWKKRKQDLVDCLAYWISNASEKTVEVIELFY
jgi:hypothetical protein